MIDENMVVLQKDAIINYKMAESVILFNTINIRWCKLSYEEYELFDNYTLQKHNPIELGFQNLLLKLLINGIINFKNEEFYYESIEKPPLTVYFEPTPYCNLNCVYCYAEAEGSSEMTWNTDKSLILLDKIAQYPTLKNIVFSGGEPLLRKDTLDLAEYVLERHNIKPSILTNGLLINRKNVDRFKCFEKVTISLDAHVSDLHDKTRGKGTFDKVIEVIKILREKNINVTITTVISNINNKYVKEIMDFIKVDLGIRNHNMGTHISMGRGADSCIECTTQEVLDSRKIYFNYLCENNSEEDIDILLRPNIEQGQIRNTCGAGLAEAFVKDDGSVFPCRLLTLDKYYLGNLLENTLNEILDNEKTKEIRSMFNVHNYNSCNNCKYMNICGGGCRSAHAAYTGDIKNSAETLCTILKNEIDCAVMINNGYNPITREIRR